MQNKESLPDSRDGAFWAGDNIKVKKSLLKNSICEEHDFKVFMGERRVECKSCGYGFIFKVNEVEEEEEKLKITTKFWNQPIYIRT